MFTFECAGCHHSAPNKTKRKVITITTGPRFDTGDIKEEWFGHGCGPTASLIVRSITYGYDAAGNMKKRNETQTLFERRTITDIVGQNKFTFYVPIEEE